MRAQESEDTRLLYLERMGIDVWRPRDPVSADRRIAVVVAAPVAGRAEELLAAMLRATGWPRERVRIIDISGVGDLAGEARPPALILALGLAAARQLLASDAAIDELRGVPHEYGAGRIPLIVSYEPDHLLRVPQAKALAWEDLKRARSLVAGGADAGFSA